MIETMKVYGGNNYKVPHLGKHKLEQEGQLPLTLHYIVIPPLLIKWNDLYQSITMSLLMGLQLEVCVAL
jgi:hypothetical protein